jgi:hypothetical protein
VAEPDEPAPEPTRILSVDELAAESPAGPPASETLAFEAIAQPQAAPGETLSMEAVEAVTPAAGGEEGGEDKKKKKKRRHR